MAEPARKIYDKDDKQPVTRPDLVAMEGGGESSSPKTGHLQAVDSPNTAKPNDLAKAEKSAAKSETIDDTLGKGYTKSEKYGRGFTSFRNLSKNQKRATVGIGAAALIATAIIAILALFVVPLKILHIVNNLEDRFYASAENAVDKEVDRLFSNYVKKKIRLGGCGAVIDHNCNPFNAGDSLVTRLYRGWSNGRLEEKMWKNGEGFQIRRSGGGYEIHYGKANISASLGSDFASAGNTDTVDDVLRKNGNWSTATRNEIRQAFRTSMEGETRWKSTMYRIKVGRLLEKKYGIKRCIVGCKYRDNFDDWGDNKKRAYKMYLSDRVLKPRAEVFSLMVECMLTPGLCNDLIDDIKPGDYKSTSSGCTSNCTDGGEPMSDTERERLRARLLQVLATSFDSDPERLKRNYDDIYKNGYSKYIIGSILEKITGVRSEDKGTQKLDEGSASKYVASRASRAIPILGQILLAADLITIVEEAPNMVPKLVYIANSTSMVQQFAMYRTHADEIKEGNVDAEIVGTFVDSLAPGDHQIEGEGEEQIGGTVGAEQTPLYQSLIANAETRTELTSPIARILGDQVFAAQHGEANDSTPEYLCKDSSGNESPVPVDSLTCPEFNLRQGSNLDFINKIKAILGPQWDLLASAAGIISDLSNGALGLLFSAVGAILGAICNIPLVGYVCGPLEDAINFAVDKFFDAIKPYAKVFAEALWQFFQQIMGINANIVSGDMSGGRTFDLMAGGADVSGNDYAHHGLGGVVLTKEQTAENLAYFEQKQYLEYKHKSFLGRFTDTESEHSPMVKLAMAMPSNHSSAINNLASALSNPLKTMASMFNAIVSLPSAGAQTPRVFEEDPFGVYQYGFPLNDPALEMDSDDYWNTYCVSDSAEFLTQSWNEFAANNLDDSVFVPQNTPNNFGSGSPMGTNRCLLIQAAVGSSGAIYTDEVLTAEEIANQASNNSGDGTGGTCETTSEVGTPPAKYANIIAQYAPNRSQPGVCPTPSNAVPNDPNKQFFGQMANDGNAKYFGSQNEVTGSYGMVWTGPGNYIAVKYRNPPQGGNSMWIPVSGSSGGGGVITDPPVDECLPPRCIPL